MDHNVIFDLCEESVDINIITALILQKAEEEENAFCFFRQCYIREKELKKYNSRDSLVCQYYVMYIELDKRASMQNFCDNIDAGNVEFLCFVFSHCPQLISDACDFKIDRVRTKILLSIPFVRHHVITGIERYGDELNNSLIYRIIGNDFRLLDAYIGDIKSCDELCVYIYKCLRLNIAYTHDDPHSAERNRCSSIKHIVFLWHMASYILSDREIEHYTGENKRTDYTMLPTDTLAEKMIINAGLGMDISFNTVMKIYVEMSSHLNSMFAIMGDQEIKEEYDKVRAIVIDNPAFLKNATVCAEKLVLCSGFCDTIVKSVYEYTANMVADLKQRPPLFLRDFVINHMTGKIKTNRDNKVKILGVLNLVTAANMDYFMGEKSQFFEGVCKNIIDSDVSDVIHPGRRNGSMFYEHLLKLLGMYHGTPGHHSRLYDHVFYKIASMLSTLHEVFKSACVIPNAREIIKSTINNMRLSLDTLYRLINNGFVNLEPELTMPVSVYTVSMLKVLLDGKHPLYEIFRLNTESIRLIKSMYALIDKCCANNSFVDDGNSKLILEMLCRSSIDSGIKKRVSDAIDACKMQIDIEYPDEFLDGLLNTPIHTPVMIPDIDQFFDRKSIVSWLYSNNTNPYTRKELSIEELEKYNKTPPVVEKIKSFVDKYNEFKKSKGL